MSKNTICCVLNYAPHYREEIFLLMDSELNCDFYFGNKTFATIKKIDYSKFNTDVKELNFKKFFRNYYFLKGQINLAFKDYKYYIITGQPYNLSSWVLLLVSKLRGKKTYIWNHGWYGNESFIKKILKKAQVMLSSGYLLYGNYAKKLMIEEGFKEEKLFVIYNSLFYNEQTKIRKELIETSVYKNYFNNDYPTIIFIGRLTAIKKLEMLLEAMKDSFKDNIFFNLIFVGSGTEKENLKELVIKYNLNSNTWFYGSCYDEEKIGELIFNASICVSPGNIGLTAIHSLSYGTPAITHNNFVNQMPEFEVINEGVTGSFFKENNVTDLKLTIQNWLFKHSIKDDELIQNCYSVIDQCYNPNVQINLLKEILK